MLHVPLAASQTWKVIPFNAVVALGVKVKAHVAAVLPAEVLRVNDLEVTWAAKTLDGTAITISNASANVMCIGLCMTLLKLFMCVFFIYILCILSHLTAYV